MSNMYDTVIYNVIYNPGKKNPREEKKRQPLINDL
mgnify:CR=1 FL=1